MPQLIAPHTRVHASFLDALAEFAADGTEAHVVHPHEVAEFGDIWHRPDGFAGYVARLRAEALEDGPRPEHWVPHTVLWYVDGDTFLGRLSIRHRLSPILLEFGGHIGYAVRPGARRQGHATAMLRDALPHARRLGLGSVLLTCDHDNVGSRRVIEANGGAFEDRRGEKRRYWIRTDL
ncbi:GNAT family N-acetyltransferase [Streptomyces sp. NPDC006274]|uniref:GNAT family N-acetyltransferase n=1 Tax=unclassified Streptomyces TaxID=2593676 RepID=UPI0033A1DD23